MVRAAKNSKIDSSLSELFSPNDEHEKFLSRFSGDNQFSLDGPLPVPHRRSGCGRQAKEAVGDKLFGATKRSPSLYESTTRRVVDGQRRMQKLPSWEENHSKKLYLKEIPS
jgi:hypothetical protein